MKPCSGGKLNENGWNTNGKINDRIRVRCIYIMAPVREQIIEWSLGVNEQFTCGQIEYDIHHCFIESH